MTAAQSQVVLDLACYADQFLPGNYHYSNHTDIDGIGLVLIANKTRLVVSDLWKTTFNPKMWCQEG